MPSGPGEADRRSSGHINRHASPGQLRGIVRGVIAIGVVLESGRRYGRAKNNRYVGCGDLVRHQVGRPTLQPG